jgi:hypothetical protein
MTWCHRTHCCCYWFGTLLLLLLLLLQEDVFVNLRPDREAAEGPTGNEGAPVDR